MDISKERRIQATRDQNPQVVSKNFEVNSTDWGMAGKNLEVYQTPADCIPETTGKCRQLGKAELLRDMRDASVRALSAPLFGEGVQNDSAWPTVFMLAYYSYTFKPESFVDFSFISGTPSFIVPFLRPCITYVGVNSCDDPALAKSLVGSIVFLERRILYQGRFHFVSGDVNTSFKRLAESVKLCQKYDLIHFIPELFPETFLNQLEYIIPHTSNGGGIVVSTDNPGFLKAINTYLSENHKGCPFVKSYKNRVGLILKYDSASDAENKKIGFEDETEEWYLNSILANVT
jgi:hypothetical protein